MGVNKIKITDRQGNVLSEDVLTPITSVSATIDNNIGTPEVSAEYEDGELSLSFSNMKGEIGQTGPQGLQGDSAVYDPNDPNVPDFVMANTTGQSTTKAMTQKAVTDAIGDMKSEILEGVEQNYITGKAFKYKTTADGEIINKSGCCIFKENIPVTNEYAITWRFGEYNIGALVFYDDNGDAIANFGANEGSGTRTIPKANIPSSAAYLNCSFKQSNVTIPITINGVNYSRIERQPSLDDVDEDVADLETRMTAAETAIEGKTSVVLSGESGQSTELGMTQKAITDAIDDLEDEILDGVESNYYKNKSVKYADGTIESRTGWGCFKNMIPCANGDSLVWTFGQDNVSGVGLAIYDSNGVKLMAWGNSVAGGSTSRNITISGYPSCAYVNCSFKLTHNGQPITVPLTINGVACKRVEKIQSLKGLEDYDEVKARVSNLEDIVIPSDTQHGFVGKYYPEQVKEINDIIGNAMDDTQKSTYFKRLQFLHVSDNHANLDLMGHAPEFLSYCPAEFLVNTGDLVIDSWNNQESRSYDQARGASKPVYFTMGNHDYYKAPSHQDVFNNYYGDPETEGTLTYNNIQKGGVGSTKTYYSLNHSASMVKCIFLDMNDGWDDSVSGWSNDLSKFSVGKMSQTQINWFISELQSARTNNYHVCIFMHILPATIDKSRTIIPFTDNALSNTAIGLSFLHDLVDGFINGGTVSFTYDGNDYSATFSAGGAFVAWFTGHTHWDSVGWLKDYPKQFAVIVTRPNARQMWDGSVWSSNITKFNFVTIDTAQNSLAVYRVGQQKTVWGVDRKSFRIYYR